MAAAPRWTKEADRDIGGIPPSGGTRGPRRPFLFSEAEIFGGTTRDSARELSPLVKQHEGSRKKKEKTSRNPRDSGEAGRSPEERVCGARNSDGGRSMRKIYRDRCRYREAGRL